MERRITTVGILQALEETLEYWQQLYDLSAEGKFDEAQDSYVASNCAMCNVMASFECTACPVYNICQESGTRKLLVKCIYRKESMTAYEYEFYTAKDALEATIHLYKHLVD